MKAKNFYVSIILAISLSACGASRAKPEKTGEKTTKAKSEKAENLPESQSSKSTSSGPQPKIATAPVKATIPD
ncbi:MAG TPA: hypothetical protein PKV79_08805 [Candidatus Marinimicrobia bacterium]|mgnify:FL=1|nr:hypothetical protein [Candidatus Neomarinimicrobiota bacterium]